MLALTSQIKLFPVSFMVWQGPGHLDSIVQLKFTTEHWFDLPRTIKYYNEPYITALLSTVLHVMTMVALFSGRRFTVHIGVCVKL